jgi:hypothetical protein
MQMEVTLSLCANNFAFSPAAKAMAANRFSNASAAAAVMPVPRKSRRLIATPGGTASGIMIFVCSYGFPLTRASWNEGLLLSVFMVLFLGLLLVGLFIII